MTDFCGKNDQENLPIRWACIYSPRGEEKIAIDKRKLRNPKRAAGAARKKKRARRKNKGGDAKKKPAHSRRGGWGRWAQAARRRAIPQDAQEPPKPAERAGRAGEAEAHNQRRRSEGIRSKELSSPYAGHGEPPTTHAPAKREREKLPEEKPDGVETEQDRNRVYKRRAPKDTNQR